MQSTATNAGTAPDLGYIHQFVRGTRTDGLTLLLLHGTGGDENDLIQLGEMLAPDANYLSPRGNVLDDDGSARFFRRIAEGVFDEQDLIARTADLAEFIRSASGHYGFDLEKVVAVGFSNGANIAGSLLLRAPRVLKGALLLRAMVPCEPSVFPVIDGTTVTISAGNSDPLVDSLQPTRLAEILRQAGADVTLEWQVAAHGLVSGDVEAGRAMLTKMGFDLGHGLGEGVVEG